MRVDRHHNPGAFLAAAGELLLASEAENQFFLGAAPQLSNPTDVLLFTVHDDSTVAAAFMTPGRHMMLTRAPRAAIAALIDYLTGEDIAIPGVQSARREIEDFIQLWTAQHPAKTRAGLALGLYKLDRVQPPRPVPGSLRLASEADLDLLAGWIDAFSLDIHEAPGEGRGLAQRVLPQERLFLWQTPQGARSMAAWTRPTASGVAINLVYTPPEFRGCGYASACVAALSQRMLDSGKKFCVLYTDLANPTSNKIYQQIGYRHVSDTHQVFFDPSIVPILPLPLKI